MSARIMYHVVFVYLSLYTIFIHILSTFNILTFNMMIDPVDGGGQFECRIVL